jgi:hypothetical protein
MAKLKQMDIEEEVGAVPMGVLPDEPSALDAEEQPDEQDERDEEIQALVSAAAKEAVDYYDEVLEERYVQATKYYYGRPFGDEEKGRSKIVSTDLRDTALTQVPNMHRMFLGTEKSVEFRGHGPEDDEVAKQQTDHTNYVIREDNSAFLTFNALFKDFLLRKAAVKWYWDEFSRVEEIEYTGLDMDEAAVFEEDEDVEILDDSIQLYEDGTVDLTIRRTRSGGVERYVAIPPEELIYTPTARELATAPLVGHVRVMPRDQVLALGVSEEDIDEFGDAPAVDGDSLTDVRRDVKGSSTYSVAADAGTLDESQKPVLYGELYMLVDGDGDKTSERRLFQTIGTKFHVTNRDSEGNLGEIVDEIPIAMGVMDPEAHTVEGLNDYDLLGDLQHITSHIERESMNSLGKAVDPKTFVSDRVNMPDLMAPDVKGHVRVQGDPASAVYTERHEFVGNHTLPFLEYFQRKIERRVGRNDGSTALDADALQSTTKAAVRAQLTAAQLRMEMIAISFAEQIMRPLFKGLLGLSVQHRVRERTIRLRNKWVTVDPRKWDSTMDVHINIALGQGLPEDRRQILQLLYGEQEKHMLQGSPMVSWKHLRNTVGMFCELGGWTNSDLFFASQEEIDAKLQEMAQNPKPQSDPAMALVEIERQKLELLKQKQEAELMLAVEKMKMENDRERDKISRDFMLKIEEIKAKFGVQLQQAQIDAAVERDRTAQEQETARQTAVQAPVGE